MADFCKPCSIGHFGKDHGDIRAEPNTTLTTLCEGCGWVTVDPDGNVLSVEPYNFTETDDGQDSDTTSAHLPLGRNALPLRWQ